MRLDQLGAALGAFVQEKNAAYGNSFEKAGAFLALLYPNGIAPEQYGDALLLVRIFDKQMRVATRKDAFGESPYLDIAGYGLLGAHKDGAKLDVKLPDVERAKSDLDSTIGLLRTYFGENPRELNALLDAAEAKLEWCLGSLLGETGDETRARLSKRKWRSEAGPVGGPRSAAIWAMLALSELDEGHPAVSSLRAALGRLEPVVSTTNGRPAPAESEDRP